MMNDPLVKMAVDMVADLMGVSPDQLIIVEDLPMLFVEHEGSIMTHLQYIDLRAIEELHPETRWNMSGDKVICCTEVGHFVLNAEGGYTLVTPDGVNLSVPIGGLF
jgi:hypothetical protein